MEGFSSVVGKEEQKKTYETTRLDSDVPQAEDPPTSIEVADPDVEKRLVRKFDLIVLPLVGIVYFTHAMDRASLGNAKTNGFEEDIGLKANQYSLILIIFYIAYGSCSIPATVIAKHFSPAVVIPILMFLWGIISTATAAVKNFKGILIARIFLGIVESGFSSSAIYYLSMFYTRHELAKRISVYYMMGFISSAFGGLIAYRVFQWHRTLHNWQYLFIIEGGLTIFLAIVCFVILPRDVTSSRYFSESEKKCALIRKSGETGVESSKFLWSATLRPLTDWHVWIFGFMSLCSGVAAASIANFLPTMIKRLTVDAVKANLYTIGPNLSGAVFLILACWMSDHFQLRGLVCIGSISISMIGFICLGTIDLLNHASLGYFFCFLLTCGCFTPAVIIPAWASNNIVSASGRATTLGLLTMMQNTAGIISSVSFRSQDAPIYAPALVTSACFQGAMILTAGFAYLYYRNMNIRLNSGKLQYVEGMKENLSFRYIL